jgi:hypothetical protein
MFQRLPREYKAHHIKSVPLDPSKMYIGIRQRERRTNKADIIGIKEAFADMGRNMRVDGILCVASQVYSSQCNDSGY